MNKRILVVDDEPPIQEVIQGCLEELADWEVWTALSGPEGLQLAQSGQPDGILLDVSMAEMDGLAVLQALKANPVTQAIPVVLLTARVQASDRAQFAELPIAGVIQKPFDPLALADQIADAFGWEL
jgi:CheY-like chemotaxis protein